MGTEQKQNKSVYPIVMGMKQGEHRRILTKKIIDDRRSRVKKAPEQYERGWRKEIQEM